MSATLSATSMSTIMSNSMSANFFWQPPCWPRCRPPYRSPCQPPYWPRIIPFPKIYYVEVWGDGVVHCWMGKAPGQKENGEEVDDWVAAGTDGQQSPFYHRRLFSGPPRIRREDSLGIIIRLDTHRQQHLRCLYCHLSPDRQCIMYCSANVLQRDCICRIVH